MSKENKDYSLCKPLTREYIFAEKPVIVTAEVSAKLFQYTAVEEECNRFCWMANQYGREYCIWTNEKGVDQINVQRLFQAPLTWLKNKPVYEGSQVYLNDEIVTVSVVDGDGEIVLDEEYIYRYLTPENFQALCSWKPTLL